MKKIAICILIAAMFALQLSGCGVDKKEAPNTPATVETGDASNTDQQAGALEVSTDSNPTGKDNSQDVYSMAINTPLQVEHPANAINGGGEKILLGKSRAYHFKKHLFENVEECWDELSFVTAEGETGSESFDLKNQLWDIGLAAGTDHYVTFDIEAQAGEGDCRYFLTERGEHHEALREFPLDFLNGSGSSEVETIMSFSKFAVDSSGTVHLVRQTDEQQYLLVSPTGELLAEYVPKDGYIEGLISLYDGRVAFWETKPDNESQSVRLVLQYMDAETSQPIVLATAEKEVYCLTLFDEKILLYADQEGVYRSELSGKNPELLYRWSNHGISVLGVPFIQADEEGQIALIYEDNENYNYLCLKPTTEEVEICEITIAVPPYRMSSYRPMVVEFNKRYPRYHVELKSDYDDTALLTELTAGKGPVLIDTLLTGFEEQEQQWEPLDAIMEQLGITEELLPSVLDMGRIHGALYGVVTDFRLRTLITGDSTLKDWDYDAFLQCVEGKPDLEAIFDFYGGDYGTYFITSFLSHGIDDTYLLDAETRTLNFDSSDFRRALELAKKYCVREEGVSPGTSLLEGKVLCNELTISKPEDFAAYRICYGENANYIGYPTKNGAAHFMESGSNPLAIRRTATEEEKEAAIAFISVCLSYEGQIQASRDLNYGLSVRKDVLEEQIAAMTEDTVVDTHGFGRIVLGDDLNIEQDRTALLDMVDKARPLRYFPMELMNIMSEELEQYFSDTITEELTIDHLKSRVGLYLEEGRSP